MVDLQQVFIEKTKSNLQHKSSTTGVLLLHGGSSPKKRHLHQEKIAQERSPSKKVSTNFITNTTKLEKNEGRTRNPAKKLPHKKLGCGSSPVQQKQGSRDTTNPNSTLGGQENPHKMTMHMCILLVQSLD